MKHARFNRGPYNGVLVQVRECDPPQEDALEFNLPGAAPDSWHLSKRDNLIPVVTDGTPV